ncbi:MAG TPA: YggS family pyridoxal phosphate-dependent enzyme [Spirochaetia bacterium]|nr:YggS family pyridoxal phosphate-dependent enzyme [Spirochaetia bacterium]
MISEAVPSAGSREFLATALPRVLERIARAAGRAGRDPSEVRLMAVTKGFPKETVEAAIAGGITLLGENRVQEAELKYAEITGSYELHLIGHLQRNKARTASGLFSCVQSIDKEETAAALESRLAEREKTIDVLLELNTSGEASKSGFRSRDQLLSSLDSLVNLRHLRLRGLMTVGPLTDDERAVRLSFAALRELFEEIRRAGAFHDFSVLSMGMSGDFEAAIEEGATIVRIGTALFGQRGSA